MPASKSRDSKEGKAKRNRYARARVYQTVPTKRVIVVVCDDAKTAVAYFYQVKKLVRDHTTLHVYGKPYDRADSHEVVQLAIKLANGLKEDGTHDDDDRDCVWALVDTEWDPARRAAAHEAKKLGEQRQVQVALSDPCYEVWTLLHLEGTGETFMNCAAVLARVEVEWPRAFGQAFGPKAQADYAKLMPLITLAVDRARKNHGAATPSWTEVYKAVQVIIQPP